MFRKTVNRALLCLPATLLMVSVRAADSPLPSPTPEQGVDHARLIRSLNADALARGEQLYNLLCLPCHGTPEQPGSLPASRAFWKEPFKRGSDPFSISETMRVGLEQMPAWPSLAPEQRYDLVHFVREKLVRPHNPAAYFPVTPAYLASLPKGEGEFVKTPEMLEFERGPKYLQMDFGPALLWTYQVASNNIAYKGIAIRLDEGPGGISRGHAWMLYDHDTLRLAAAWSGDKFIDWRGIAFDGSHGTHASIVGQKHLVNPPGPGWASPASRSFTDPRLRGLDGKPYGPLPPGWARFKALYLHDHKVVLAYSVGDAEILELPGAQGAGEALVYSRLLNIGKSSRDLSLRLAPLDTSIHLSAPAGLKVQEVDGFSTLTIPAAATPLRLQVRFGPGLPSAPSLSDPATLPDLIPLTRGGAPRWDKTIPTVGTLGSEHAAFAVDTIPYPAHDQNPWRSWMRLTGLDFFRDGRRAAVCTWMGDVWLVTGLDADLQDVKWKRIASGLFQPLGLKIVDDTIYVGCRDQIARLRDLNGDEEIDALECFNNDHQVTEHFHEFAMGLQTDREGNFYYAKSARHALPALVPHHGTLLKVSRDGSRTDIIAHGFRAANGVCVNDDGTFFVTDQEGHWVPKNRINLVRPGGFYGNMFVHSPPASTADSAMEQPLVWITNAKDRSPGELVRVPADRWGPFAGSLLNISYGTGRIFLVPHQHLSTAHSNPADSVAPPGKSPASLPRIQGGVVELPIPDFPTGTMRGRFHPQDGHLYLCGMYAWAGNRQQDGGLYRLRYTGQPAHLPVGLRAARRGLQLTFTDPVHPDAARNVTNYTVSTWTLRRSERYGSAHHDLQVLPVHAAHLSSDRRSVLLEIPNLAPVQSMEIKYQLQASDGAPFAHSIHNTIHFLTAE